MKCMGFVFSTNDFRYVVIEGSLNLPVFIEKQKITYPQSNNVSEHCVWLETQLNLLLSKHSPDIVGHKATINLKKFNQMQGTYYSESILYLICGKLNIPVEHFFKQSIVPKKFDLPKDSDLNDFLDTKIGQHPPHWDETTRTAALIAFLLME